MAKVKCTSRVSAAILCPSCRLNASLQDRLCAQLHTVRQLQHSHRRLHREALRLLDPSHRGVFWQQLQESLYAISVSGMTAVRAATAAGARAASRGSGDSDSGERQGGGGGRLEDNDVGHSDRDGRQGGIGGRPDDSREKRGDGGEVDRQGGEASSREEHDTAVPAGVTTRTSEREVREERGGSVAGAEDEEGSRCEETSVAQSVSKERQRGEEEEQVGGESSGDKEDDRAQELYAGRADEAVVRRIGRAATASVVLIDAEAAVRASSTDARSWLRRRKDESEQAAGGGADEDESMEEVLSQAMKQKVRGC